jgi:hypothetical protein
MSRENIYNIQLLNDLHNYFPEILYNPRQFQTVQDLLTYIRNVANQSPYSRGYALYTQQQNNRVIRNTTTTRQTHSHNPTLTTTWTTVIPETAPVRNGLGTTSVENTLINTLLGSLLGESLDVPLSANLNDFLNQRVIVYPTDEEVERATILYRTSRNLDDNCAICQDEINANQEVRRLHHCEHYFHRECIDVWFQQNVHCPTCRHDIRAVQEQNIPPPVPENYRRTNVRNSDTQ